MDTKPLLYGLIGFFIGGLLVSVAATTFDKPQAETLHGNELSMGQMEDSLRNKTGDDFDAAFIAGMIEHHKGAVEMAQLSQSNAKHSEITELSTDIIKAQEAEIELMQQWQRDWGYQQSTDNHMMDGPHN